MLFLSFRSIGTNVWELINAELLEAIFLALHMQKINGLEFLRILKSHEETKSLPIVVLEFSIRMFIRLIQFKKE